MDVSTKLVIVCLLFSPVLSVPLGRDAASPNHDGDPNQVEQSQANPNLELELQTEAEQPRPDVGTPVNTADSESAPAGAAEPSDDDYAVQIVSEVYETLKNDPELLARLLEEEASDHEDDHLDLSAEWDQFQNFLKPSPQIIGKPKSVNKKAWYLPQWYNPPHTNNWNKNWPHSLAVRDPEQVEEGMKADPIVDEGEQGHPAVEEGVNAHPSVEESVHAHPAQAIHMGQDGVVVPAQEIHMGQDEVVVPDGDTDEALVPEQDSSEEDAANTITHSVPKDLSVRNPESSEPSVERVGGSEPSVERVAGQRVNGFWDKEFADSSEDENAATKESETTKSDEIKDKMSEDGRDTEVQATIVHELKRWHSPEKKGIGFGHRWHNKQRELGEDHNEMALQALSQL